MEGPGSFHAMQCDVSKEDQVSSEQCGADVARSARKLPHKKFTAA